MPRFVNEAHFTCGTQRPAACPTAMALPTRYAGHDESPERPLEHWVVFTTAGAPQLPANSIVVTPKDGLCLFHSYIASLNPEEWMLGRDVDGMPLGQPMRYNASVWAANALRKKAWAWRVVARACAQPRLNVEGWAGMRGRGRSHQHMSGTSAATDSRCTEIESTMRIICAVALHAHARTCLAVSVGAACARHCACAARSETAAPARAARSSSGCRPPGKKRKCSGNAPKWALMASRATRLCRTWQQRSAVRFSCRSSEEGRSAYRCAPQLHAAPHQHTLSRQRSPHEDPESMLPSCRRPQSNRHCLE